VTGSLRLHRRLAAAVLASAATSLTVAGMLAPAPSAGGAVVAPASTPPSGRLAFFTDSNYYGSSSTVQLAVAAANGSGTTVLLRNRSNAYGYPAFSPNGSELAFLTAVGASTRIDVMNIATRKITVAYRSPAKSAPTAGVAWSSSGTDLYFGSAGRANGTVAGNLALWKVSATGGSARRLTSFDGASDPTVGSNGAVYYVVARENGAGSSSLWTMGPTGAGAHEVFRAPYLMGLPAVSPNGQSVAYTHDVNATTANIEEVGTNGQGHRALTPEVQGRYDALPSWSPGGRHLSFLSSRDGRHFQKASNQLYDGFEMTAAGTDVTPVVTLAGNRAGVDWLTWGT